MNQFLDEKTQKPIDEMLKYWSDVIKSKIVTMEHKKLLGEHATASSEIMASVKMAENLSKTEK